MSGLPASLARGLANTATGWGVVIDGVLNIHTVTETRKGAAYNALFLSGVRAFGACNNPDCRCTEEALAKALPQARLVRVKVEVAE